MERYRLIARSDYAAAARGKSSGVNRDEKSEGDAEEKRKREVLGGLFFTYPSTWSSFLTDPALKTCTNIYAGRRLLRLVGSFSPPSFRMAQHAAPIAPLATPPDHDVESSHDPVSQSRASQHEPLRPPPTQTSPAASEERYAPKTSDFAHIASHQAVLAEIASLSPLQITLMRDASRILQHFSSSLELLNEAMDVTFLPELRRATPSLYYVSLAFLGLMMATRLYIVLSFLRGRVKPGHFTAFLRGALVYLLEPNLGMQFIEPHLKNQSFERNVDERTILTHEVDGRVARATLKSTAVMVLFEDLPEVRGVCEERSAEARWVYPGDETLMT